MVGDMSEIQGAVRTGGPKPERLYGVGELAGMFQVPYKTMLRRLLALHRQHGGPWMMRMGTQKLLINLSLFRAHHPHVFGVDVVSRGEVEEMQERIDELEKNATDEKRRLNGAFARVRRVESSVQCMLNLGQSGTSQDTHNA